jgi:hypothetical protein
MFKSIAISGGLQAPTAYRVRGVFDKTYVHEHEATREVVVVPWRHWQSLEAMPDWDCAQRSEPDTFHLHYRQHAVGVFYVHLPLSTLADCVVGTRVLVPNVHSGLWIPAFVEDAAGCTTMRDGSARAVALDADELDPAHYLLPIEFIGEALNGRAWFRVVIDYEPITRKPITDTIHGLGPISTPDDVAYPAAVEVQPGEWRVMKGP